MKQSILTLINNNLKKCLIILILLSVLDVAAFVGAYFVFRRRDLTMNRPIGIG